MGTPWTNLNLVVKRCEFCGSHFHGRKILTQPLCSHCLDNATKLLLEAKKQIPPERLQETYWDYLLGWLRAGERLS